MHKSYRKLHVEAVWFIIVAVVYVLLLQFVS